VRRVKTLEIEFAVGRQGRETVKVFCIMIDCYSVKAADYRGSDILGIKQIDKPASRTSDTNQYYPHRPLTLFLRLYSPARTAGTGYRSLCAYPGFINYRNVMNRPDPAYGDDISTAGRFIISYSVLM
jgi:hypothetical protein